MKNKKINIAIVGLGNIGLYLYEHINKHRGLIEKKTNVKLNIKYVSAKNPSKKRRIKIPKIKWLKNAQEAAIKKDIDIVIGLLVVLTELQKI